MGHRTGQSGRKEGAGAREKRAGRKIEAWIIPIPREAADAPLTNVALGFPCLWMLSPG